MILLLAILIILLILICKYTRKNRVKGILRRGTLKKKKKVTFSGKNSIFLYNI